jgi:hypothetical protein
MRTYHRKEEEEDEFDVLHPGPPGVRRADLEQGLFLLEMPSLPLRHDPVRLRLDAGPARPQGRLEGRPPRAQPAGGYTRNLQISIATPSGAAFPSAGAAASSISCLRSPAPARRSGSRRRPAQRRSLSTIPERQQSALPYVLALAAIAGAGFQLLFAQRPHSGE